MLEDKVLDAIFKDIGKELRELIKKRKRERKVITKEDLYSIISEEDIKSLKNSLEKERNNCEKFLHSFIEDVLIKEIKNRDSNLVLKYNHVTEVRCNDCESLTKIYPSHPLKGFLADKTLMDMIKVGLYELVCQKKRCNSIDVNLVSTRNIISLDSKVLPTNEISGRIKSTSLGNKAIFKLLLDEDLSDYIGARIITKKILDHIEIEAYLKKILIQNVNELNKNRKRSINLGKEIKEYESSIEPKNFPPKFESKERFSAIEIKYPYYTQYKTYNKRKMQKNMINIQIIDEVSNIHEQSTRPRYAEQIEVKRIKKLRELKLEKEYKIIMQEFGDIFKTYDLK